MIVDHIRNAACYAPLDATLAAGLDYLSTTDFSALPNGKIALRGDALYAVINRYPTKPAADAKWEAHRAYIDIQYVVSGREQIGYGDVADMQVTEAYAPGKDCLFLHGAGNGRIRMACGMFAIFFPQDAHQPGMALEASEEVMKVVVKVAVPANASTP